MLINCMMALEGVVGLAAVLTGNLAHLIVF